MIMGGSGRAKLFSSGVRFPACVVPEILAYDVYATGIGPG
jgi:hypothetical protein